ncbi:MAG: 3-keto-5-aminohexanoate cleavage protein [Kordiimonas sp.]
MREPFILMCAPNGARRTKEDHVRLPITPSEIADCAVEIYEAGASIIHLHVRSELGEHSLAPEHYRSAMQAIKAKLGSKLLVQITTEAVGRYSRFEQMAVVKDLKPEAVSIALREICPTENEVIEKGSFWDWMQRENIFPQIILYDQQDILRFLELREQGVFGAQNLFVLCVLGRNGPVVLNEMEKFASALSNPGISWAVCGFGKSEHDLPLKAASLGGHVRVGFENNVWRPDGVLADNNAELISVAKKQVEAQGHVLATANDVREMFQLQQYR